MITGATCTAIELVDCGGPELVRTDVSCQLDRFGCTWLACSKMRRRGWGGREMLANETPVCVTIRDCCTAGFDVHLQASTIHPSLSLSLYPILLLLPAFYFLPSIPSFVSPLLSHPFDGNRGRKRRRRKGLDRFVRPWRCKSAKTKE